MAERKPNWVRRVFLGVSVIGLFVVGLLAFGLYKLTHSESGAKIVGMLGGALRIGANSVKGPGPKALLEAGCAQALVISAEEVRRAFEKAGADQPSSSSPTQSPKSARLEGTVVVCSMRRERPDVTCSTLARVLGEADESAAEPFTIELNIDGERAGCSGVFSRDGARLRDR